MADTVKDRLPDMLRAGESEREAACQELRDLLVRAALAYLARKHYPIEAFGADDAESLAEDFAQESLTIILRQLDSFRGESRFTTWAYRIVINLMADEFRRRAWRHRSLDEEQARLPERTAADDVPHLAAERREIWELVQQVIREDLTERQRRVLVGRFFQDKPLVVLAEEMNTTKDNVYKLLHDARKHLRRALLARGISEQEALRAFERT